METAIHKQMISRLNSIPWFQSCGQKSDLGYAVSIAESSEIIKNISSLKWGNTILEHRGNFTVRLFKEFREEYNRYWNLAVNECKEKYMPELTYQWSFALKKHELDIQEIIADIQFNVLCIIVIDAYKNCIPMPDFFVHMLEIYESGHLPCGWKGKKEKGCFLLY